MSRSRGPLRLAIVLTLGAGVLWLGARLGATEEKPPPDTVRQLLQQRLEVTEQIVALLEKRLESGNVDWSRLNEARQEALEAKLALAESSKERIAVYQEMVDQAQRYLGRMKSLNEVAHATQVEVLQAKSELLKVQIKLEREKSRL